MKVMTYEETRVNKSIELQTTNQAERFVFKAKAESGSRVIPPPPQKKGLMIVQHL